MAKKIKLVVVTPHGKVLDKVVDEVNAPGEKGAFGVLPGHTFYLASLTSGALWYRVADSKEYLAVHGGYADVGPDWVTILAESAEKPEDIDLERAEKAQKKAKEKLKGLNLYDNEYVVAHNEVQRALTRISLADRK